jgi:hypothetical protein
MTNNGENKPKSNPDPKWDLLNESLISLNIESGIRKEIRDWIVVFKVLKRKYEDIRVYLKGGSVLGLQVFKLSNIRTLTDFIKFYSLNTIRDWDFVIHMNKPEPDNVKGKCKMGLYDEIIKVITNKNKFRSEGANVCMVRHKHKSLINGDEALFESAIIIKKKFNNNASIEIPMTAMYVEMGNKIYYDFFDAVGIFLLFESLDFVNNPVYKDILESKNRSKELETKFLQPYKDWNIQKHIDTLIKFTKSIRINMPTPIGGFIKIQNSEEIEYGEMNDYRQLFDNFKCTLTEKQFLLCQYSNAMRMVRLYSKHIPKSEKIKDYLSLTDAKTKPDWLLNKNATIMLMVKFDDYFKNAMFKDVFNAVEQDPNSDNVVKLFVALDAFFKKILILVVYNTLLKEINDPVSYKNFATAIATAFKNYIPTNPNVYNSTTGKILDLTEPNYTYKLFSTVSASMDKH